MQRLKPKEQPEERIHEKPEEPEKEEPKEEVPDNEDVQGLVEAKINIRKISELNDVIDKAIVALHKLVDTIEEEEHVDINKAN